MGRAPHFSVNEVEREIRRFLQIAVRSRATGASEDVYENAEVFSNEFAKRTPEEDAARNASIEERAQAAYKQTESVWAAKVTDGNTPISAFAVDSLSFAEFTHNLEKSFSIGLSFENMSDKMTINQVAEKITAVLGNQGRIQADTTRSSAKSNLR